MNSATQDIGTQTLPPPANGRVRANLPGGGGSYDTQHIYQFFYTRFTEIY